MPARFIVADVFDGLATIPDGSVDLVVTSPPFLALRSYLPADHADKGKEIGSESTPAEFIDTLLKVTAELRRVLAPHGSICVELGDTYAGGAAGWTDADRTPGYGASMEYQQTGNVKNGIGWPLAKSRTLIPSLYQIALAYGFNPLTGQPSPAGQWRIRNVVTWARPNPPVGALGDKWRPATSDLVIACTSGKRYWDDLATRHEVARPGQKMRRMGVQNSDPKMYGSHLGDYDPDVQSPSGAPLLDYWVIPPGGYTGAHYAVFPEDLVVPCVQAMCPQRVCVTCGEPSRRIVETTYEAHGDPIKHNAEPKAKADYALQQRSENAQGMANGRASRIDSTLGWSDCGHDNWRPGLVLDPFAGSGTTLAVATGHGHDAVGVDLDSRNADLARDRVGPFFFEQVEV